MSAHSVSGFWVRLLLKALVLAAAAVFLPAAFAVQQNVEVVTTGAGKFLRWTAHAGRTYFVEVADPNNPLQQWIWAPVIETGYNQTISYEVDATADRSFFRLHFIQATSANPDNADFDNDGLTNLQEITLHQTSPLDSDTDNDGLADGWEMLHGLDPLDDGSADFINGPWADPDMDTLTNLQEFAALINPNSTDTDGDWMWDDYELANGLNPKSASDGVLDADGDTLKNQLEFIFMDKGWNPKVYNNPSSFPWTEDPDLDGLATNTEYNTHQTNPRQPDTDDDWLLDSWEITYGWNPRVANTGTGLRTADPDADGLTNLEESQLGTSPVKADTDNDSRNDKLERDQGSDPLNASSSAAAPYGTIPVTILFGDHSSSYSEKYRVTLTAVSGDPTTSRRVFNSSYFGVTEETVRLPLGAQYTVDIKHVSTNPKYRDTPRPDYDYSLYFFGETDSSHKAVIVDDPLGIQGIHDESSPFHAAGKTATLYTAVMTSQTVAEQPADRKRTKLGVGEEVRLELFPSGLPSVSWSLAGTPGTSTVVSAGGMVGTLTAGARACTPQVQALVGGAALSLGFNVI